MKKRKKALSVRFRLFPGDYFSVHDIRPAIDMASIISDLITAGRILGNDLMGIYETASYLAEDYVAYLVFILTDKREQRSTLQDRHHGASKGLKTGSAGQLEAFYGLKIFVHSAASGAR
jgi:hypothetical protein